MSKIDEKRLHSIFESIKNQEDGSIETLYKEYHDLVFRIAFSILKNKENSDDVTQEVFTKIIKLEKEKYPSQFEASWLYSVTKNEVMQFLRKQKENIDIDDLYTLESESDEIEDIVDMSSYYNLIKDLNPIDQEIISLRILSDFTFDKIAQMMNLSLGTVQWRYYKSLHSIKLSISNLLAFIIVYSIWKTTNTFSNNIIETEKTSQEPEIIENDGLSYFNPQAIQSMDASGAGTSVSSVYRAVLNLGIMGISLLFIILSIYFAVRRKIKIKKK